MSPRIRAKGRLNMWAAHAADTRDQEARSCANARQSPRLRSSRGVLFINMGVDPRHNRHLMDVPRRMVPINLEPPIERAPRPQLCQLMVHSCTGVERYASATRIYVSTTRTFPTRKCTSETRICGKLFMCLRRVSGANRYTRRRAFTRRRHVFVVDKKKRVGDAYLRISDAYFKLQKKRLGDTYSRASDAFWGAGNVRVGDKKRADDAHSGVSEYLWLNKQRVGEANVCVTDS